MNEFLKDCGITKDQYWQVYEHVFNQRDDHKKELISLSCDDKDLALRILLSTPWVYDNMDIELKKDKELIVKLVAKWPDYYFYDFYLMLKDTANVEGTLMNETFEKLFGDLPCRDFIIRAIALEEYRIDRSWFFFHEHRDILLKDDDFIRHFIKAFGLVGPLKGMKMPKELNYTTEELLDKIRSNYCDASYRLKQAIGELQRTINNIESNGTSYINNLNKTLVKLKKCEFEVSKAESITWDIWRKRKRAKNKEL